MVLEYSAGAVIYRKKAKHLQYLIVQNVKNHRWGFPKGHLEGKENARQAAVREVREESGLKPNFDFNFMRKTKYTLPNDNRKEVTFFLAKALKKEKVVLQKSEIKAGKWVSLPEAVKYLTEHDKMKVLSAAEKYLKDKQK